MKWKTSIGLLCMLGSLASHAQEETQDFGEGLESRSQPLLLLNSEGQHQHWSGIGRLENDQGQCTASLIDSRATGQDPRGPAYIITSGHCVDKRNGIVAMDLPVDGTVNFNYFSDTSEQRKTFALKRRIWSSMQGVDIAVLELEASLEQVMAQGIQPLALAMPPDIGSNILVVGAPVAGTQGLWLAACTLQASAVLVEQPWVWRKTMANQCLGIAPGSSGSPILDRATNKIIGVLGTTTTIKTAHNKCGRDATCEIVDGQAVWSAETNYGNPLGFLAGCFAAGVLDPTLERCELLPAVAILQTNPWTFRRVTKIATNPDGSERLPAWGYRFNINTPFYRYKTSQNALDCLTPVGYSGTRSAMDASIDDPIGPQPGMYMLCIVGVEAAEQRPSPGMMNNSLTVAVELVGAAPVASPDISIEPRSNGAVEVSWKTSPPHLNKYRIKQGPVSTTDCNENTGYRTYFDKSHVFRAEKLPVRLCTYALDIIEQSSSLRTDIIGSVPVMSQR